MDPPPLAMFPRSGYGAPSQQAATWGPPHIDNGPNPLQTLDSRGATRPVRERAPCVTASRVIVIDSRDRNRDTHKSACSFKMQLHNADMQLVRSIELLEAVIPVLAVPTSATNNTPEVYVAMEIKVGGQTLNNGIVSAQASSATTNPASTHNVASDDAFGHFIIADALAVGAPYLVWKSSNQHRLVRRFAEPLERLGDIEITFKVRRDDTKPSLYPLAEEPTGAGGTSPLNNVFLKFEVVAAK